MLYIRGTGRSPSSAASAHGKRAKCFESLRNGRQANWAEIASSTSLTGLRYSTWSDVYPCLDCLMAYPDYIQLYIYIYIHLSQTSVDLGVLAEQVLISAKIKKSKPSCHEHHITSLKASGHVNLWETISHRESQKYFNETIMTWSSLYFMKTLKPSVYVYMLYTVLRMFPMLYVVKRPFCILSFLFLYVPKHRPRYH